MKLLLSVLLLLAGTVSQAAIGAAGCGLGNVVLGEKTGFTQVFAATLNGTSGNQTFGITSGTSNCEDSATRAQLNNYVESNKIALSKEAARGQGETLTAVSEILGCGENFNSTIKTHYKQIFSNDRTEDISNKLLQVAQNNTSACS